MALTEAFAADEAKQRQWAAFRRRSGLGGKAGELGEIITEIATFLGPPLVAAARGGEIAVVWEAGGPWILPGS